MVELQSGGDLLRRPAPRKALLDRRHEPRAARQLRRLLRPRETSRHSLGPQRPILAALPAPADLAPDRRAMAPECPRDLAVALPPADPDEDSLPLLKRQPMRRAHDPPSRERRFILNTTRGGVRHPELGHHLLDLRTAAKPRHDRRALRRRQQPIRPTRTSSLSHLILRSRNTK